MFGVYEFIQSLSIQLLADAHCLSMPQIHRMGTYVWPNCFRELLLSLLNNLRGF